MSGLLYKDIVVLRKQVSTLLLFLLVYGGFCVTGIFDFTIIGTLISVFGLTIPMSAVALDDAAHWDRYAVATPAGRQGVVRGKYLFTLLVILVSGLVGGAVMALLALTGLTQEPPAALAMVVVSCVAMTLLLDAILLPFMLKYGAEKARLISILTFVILFGSIVLLGGLMNRGGALPQLPQWLGTALPGLFVLLAVGGYLVSYFIAQGIYQRKEF